MALTHYSLLQERAAGFNPDIDWAREPRWAADGLASRMEVEMRRMGGAMDDPGAHRVRYPLLFNPSKARPCRCRAELGTPCSVHDTAAPPHARCHSPAACQTI